MEGLNGISLVLKEMKVMVKVPDWVAALMVKCPSLSVKVELFVLVILTVAPGNGLP